MFHLEYPRCNIFFLTKLLSSFGTDVFNVMDFYHLEKQRVPASINKEFLPAQQRQFA